MYVEAICPLCRATHILPVEMRGERHRCEECEEVFIVNTRSRRTNKKPPRTRTARPAADRGEGASRVPEVLPVATKSPARRGRRDEDDDRPRRSSSRRRSNRRTGLLVALSGILFTVIVVGSVGGWWYYRGRGDGLDTAQDDNHDHEVRVAVGQPIDDDPPKKDPAKTKKDREAKGDPKDDPPQWRAKADPPKPLLDLPADLRREIAGRANNIEVVFPTSTASPFIAIGDNFDDKDERQVYDLRTGKKTGELGGRHYSSAPPVLSPDGAHLAILPFGEKEIVDVWPLAGAKPVKPVRIDTDLPTDVVDFAGPGRLLVAGKRGAALHVRVWDAKTGKREVAFDGPPLGDPVKPTRDMLAVSPGGNYLAVVTPEALSLWDLRNGTPAGRHALPWNEGNWLFPCRGLSFSPDGRELAALFQVGGKSRLVSWNVQTGMPLNTVIFPELRPSPGAEVAYRGHVLGWVGQRRGWLLYGQMFVGRDDKVGPPPPGLLAPDQPFRRLVGTDHIATLPAGLGGNKVLTVAPFDPDKP
jgi:hypothetical protein